MANTPLPFSKQAVAVLSGMSANDSYQISGSTLTSGNLSSGVGSAAVSNAQTAKVFFTGTGADNSTFNVTVYGKIQTAALSSDATDTAFLLFKMGVANVTLSTLTGPSSSNLITTSHRVADTITWTASDPFSTIALENSASTGTTYSPADNTPAYIAFSYLAGASELVFDFDMSSATGGMAFVQAGTV